MLLCFKEIFKMRCYTPVNNIVQSFTYWEERPYNFSLYYTTEYDVSINCWLWQKSPMLDDTVEPLALLDPLEEGWEVFVKKWLNRLKIFISCLRRSLPARDLRESAVMLDSMNTFLHNLHLALVIFWCFS